MHRANIVRRSWQGEGGASAAPSSGGRDETGGARESAGRRRLRLPSAALAVLKDRGKTAP